MRDGEITPARPRIDSLTGLRAVAAFGVFLTHAHESFFGDGPAAWVMLHFGSPGYTGVTFFFILSGFVLTWSHRRGDRPSAFYRRRFSRIAPAYWVTLLAGIALTSYLHRSRGVAPLLESLPSIVGIQAWFPERQIYFGGNAVGWTLSCEAFFYALFPALVLLLPRRGDHRIVAIAVLIVFTAAPTLMWIPFGHPPEWINILPLQRVTEFALGMLIAASLGSGWRPFIGYRAAVLLALTGYVAVGFVEYAYLFVAIPYALLIAAAASRDLSGRGTPMGRSLFRRLGEWSFAFYLVHQLVVRVISPLVNRLGDSLLFAILGACAALAVALLAALALYYGVEVPLERLLRGSPPRPEMLETSTWPLLEPERRDPAEAPGEEESRSASRADRSDHVGELALGAVEVGEARDKQADRGPRRYNQRPAGPWRSEK
jgi:peptidoglycan/LPS O-acetylase OafA/YrhL